MGPLVEELSVSPDTITKISSGHIDESWTKMLSEVDRRAVAQKKKAASGLPQNKASEELGPLLDKLILKVPGGLETSCLVLIADILITGD